MLSDNQQILRFWFSAIANYCWTYLLILSIIKVQFYSSKILLFSKANFSFDLIFTIPCRFGFVYNVSNITENTKWAGKYINAKFIYISRNFEAQWSDNDMHWYETKKILGTNLKNEFEKYFSIDIKIDIRMATKHSK